MHDKKKKLVPFWLQLAWLSDRRSMTSVELSDEATIAGFETGNHVTVDYNILIGII